MVRLPAPLEGRRDRRVQDALRATRAAEAAREAEKVRAEAATKQAANARSQLTRLQAKADEVQARRGEQAKVREAALAAEIDQLRQELERSHAMLRESAEERVALEVRLQAQIQIADAFRDSLQAMSRSGRAMPRTNSDQSSVER